MRRHDSGVEGRTADELVLSVCTTGLLTAGERDEIVDMCTRAFKEDFSSLFHYVQTSDHVLARLHGRLVSHAVWATRGLQPEGHQALRAFYVDAVATDPELQGRGIGRAVMERLASETRDFELGGLSTD